MDQTSSPQLEARTEQEVKLSAPGTQVRVGVGAIVKRADGKVLLGERHGSHGANKMAFPGGHLELMESWEECARREVEEETGLKVTSPFRHVATTNDPMSDEGKHYITIFMMAEAPSGLEPINMEPHKCKGWEWVSWEQLANFPDEKLFIPVINLLRGPAGCLYEIK